MALHKMPVEADDTNPKLS